MHLSLFPRFADMFCVLCQAAATTTLWDTEHICDSCFQLYVDKKLLVYQAKHSSKRKALRPFTSSLEYDVVSFRRRSGSSCFDYHEPRLNRRPSTQAGANSSSNSATPPSPELLLAANPPLTYQPLLFSPPPLQISQQLSSPLAMPSSEIIGTNSQHSFTPDDNDSPWIQGLADLKASFEARITKLRDEKAALQSEVNMLREKLNKVKEIQDKSKELQSTLDAVLQ